MQHEINYPRFTNPQHLQNDHDYQKDTVFVLDPNCLTEKKILLTGCRCQGQNSVKKQQSVLLNETPWLSVAFTLNFTSPLLI